MMIDEKLLATGPSRHRHLTVGHLNIDHASVPQMLLALRKHLHRIFHVLQDLVEGQQIEASEALNFHKITASSVHSYNISGMGDCAIVGIESGTFPSGGLHAVQKDAQSGTYIQDTGRV